MPSRPTAVAVLGIVALASSVQGQSVADRSPNFNGGWIGAPGVMHFNFIHRFSRGSPPTRKVTSSPTFLVAAGLPWRTLAGFNYATNSDLAPRYPNEWEFFARYSPRTEDTVTSLDVALQAGYNNAARSADGEVTLGKQLGALRLVGAARLFSDAYGLGESRAAFGGGAVFRFGRYLALAGDFAAVPDKPPGYSDAWSAALQIAIPYTPHSLSIQAANTNTATLQGASASRDGQRRYGFEFTIPVTLGRYIPRRASRARPVQTADTTPPADSALVPVRDSSATVETPSAPDPVSVRPGVDRTLRLDSARLATARDSAREAAARPSRPAAERPAATRPLVLAFAGMKQVAFTPARIQVARGTTVVWKNSDPLVHTVTGDDGRWTSGNIEPGATWRMRFDRPGTYVFHCVPHPFMKGVVVVQ